MSTKKFEIRTYILGAGVQIPTSESNNVRSVIICFGDVDQVFMYFVTTDTVPGSRVTVKPDGAMVAQLYLRDVDYLMFVDLLRNEKPVFAYVDPNMPHFCRLVTNAEGIGEGEMISLTGGQ